ncbi:MAG: hypothetical protein ACLQQ4_11225 [Bacteroidia bacterium]
MKTDNLIVFCLKCGDHFKREQTHHLKAVIEGTAPKANLYICKGCYDAIPETGEVKKLEVIN